MIAVFTEGEATEPDYLRALRRRLGDDTELRVDARHGRDPLDLVRIAIDCRDFGDVDDCWCLFDVEFPVQHERLKDARSLARDKGINLAISNPCFELWLILHFETHEAHLDNTSAQRRCRELGCHQGKHIDGELYMPALAAAVQRAEALDRRHHRNGTDFPDDNPSSGMHRFIRSLGLV